MKKLLLAFAVAAFAALPAFAAENPWVGNWKLDMSKSHFTGDTFTYSRAANGMMHFSDGSIESYDFKVDGKPYHSWGNRTATWTADGDNAWSQVVEADGKTLATIHRSLSADGKTLSNTYTGTKPDGTSFNDTATYVRVSGTKGLEGKWRSTKVSISAPDNFVISEPSPGTMRWELPSEKASVEGKADGSDLTINGPTLPPGMTIAFKPEGRHKFSYVQKLNGKVQGYGTQTLAADGKSYTDVSWSPGKASEKQTAFYVKQ